MSYQLASEISPSGDFHISFKNAKKHSRRAKTGQIAPLSKSKPIKSQLVDISHESPYAQIQSLSKNRSISSIKFKMPAKNQTTYLNTSTSNALLAKHKSNPSGNFTLNISESSLQLKNKLLLSASQNSANKPPAKIIEDKLLENLKKCKDKNMSLEKLDAFRTAFAEIIEKDENFGGVLRKIKEFYEQKIKADHYDSSKDIIEKLKDELKILKEKINKNKENKKYLMKKIEKLAKENTELSRRLDDRESRYVDLQDKLLKLSKIDLSAVPQDENSWKYLVSENQHLIKVCEDMRKDIKHLSRKEKKLVKLVIALKNRGFPVEDVYQEDVHREKPKKVRTCDEPVIDDSENEDLISGRPKSVEKPSIIPKLNLAEIEVSGESSATSESSEYEESEDA